MKLLAISSLLFSGCASVINGIAPTDCYDATSSSLSVTRDGQVILAKTAETVRFCPPSFRKVAPTAAVDAPAVKKP